MIQLDQRYQTITGFGASGAWWAQDVGGWEDEKRNLIIQRLFDKEEGIGLNIYRYNIGAGDGQNIEDPWRRAETFEVQPGIYDWSRDANAMWVLKAATAAGVDHVVVFANSPPARMTISGLVTGEKEGRTNISPEMYQPFARYLIDITRHLQEEGIPVTEISPINEPQWPWNHENKQEGSHYDLDDVVGLTGVLVAEIAASGLDANISVMESAQWDGSQVYIQRLLQDETIRAVIDHISLHSYWSTPQHKARVAQYMSEHYPDIPLVMSEWTEMREGRDVGMESALVLANTVHDDLTIGNVIAWHYWIAVSKYNYRDGLIYVRPSTRDVTETKRLWALGNYSRYIQPGSVRVGLALEGVDNEQVKASAWLDEANGQLVLVVINNRETAVALALPPVAGITTVSLYETSAARDLTEQYSGAPISAYSFPAQSITTIVLRKLQDKQ